MFGKIARGRIRQLPWGRIGVLAAGLLLIAWLTSTPAGLLGKADAIGYAVCHRIDVRSFHLGDRQLPLCARCSGMYLGAVLGIVYQAVIAPRRGAFPPLSVILPLGLLAAAFAADGINSYMSIFPGAPTLYQPNNTLRLLTGTGMGVAIAVLVYPAFNQTVWKNWVPRPPIASPLRLLPLLALGLLLDAIILWENPLLLYPLALISAGGVILLLAMVYSMVWLMILRAENRFSQPSELLLPLTGGFTMAMLQIALLDLGRFLLTGTWEGFRLG